ncbi:MAG: motility protein A [Phycisphaeraceae bacterium]|nr:MAG: motility protein A [Phycisphaeraceae bacterium]
MDLATLVGLVLGIALILMAIALGGSFPAYVDIPSMLIVVGGAGAATLTAFPLARMLKMPSVLTKAVKETKYDPEKLITQMVQYAEVARRDGILALEGMTSEMKDDLLITGIKMAVDGTDPALIEQILDADLENMQIRHEIGKGLVDAPARYAPAFGMIGTLIGLVAMLANMDDPSKIGAGMAAALLTTLYGAVIANVVLMPIADKLAVRNEEEILFKTIIIKGVMAIQAGDNPRVVQQKLLTYLPPKGRSTGEDERDMRRAA